jgi:hypothetical protein
VYAIDQPVTFGEAEQAQDLFGRGACALTLLGIKRQLIDILALHGKAQLAFNERLHEQSEEVQREESLDAALALLSMLCTGELFSIVYTCFALYVIGQPAK